MEIPTLEQGFLRRTQIESKVCLISSIVRAAQETSTIPRTLRTFMTP